MSTGGKVKPETKFAQHKTRPHVIRYIAETLPNGQFYGQLMSTVNGGLDLITRPEHWRDVKGNVCVSFTGTRKGLSVPQAGKLGRLLHHFQPRLFVHGDCIGADADAHVIVSQQYLGCAINTYPSTYDDQRAFTGEQYVVHEPLPPLQRNPLIIKAGDLLLACPDQPEERTRGGTWHTVRAARKMNRFIILIAPDGDIYNVSTQHRLVDIGHLF